MRHEAYVGVDISMRITIFCCEGYVQSTPYSNYAVPQRPTVFENVEYNALLLWYINRVFLRARKHPLF